MTDKHAIAPSDGICKLDNPGDLRFRIWGESGEKRGGREWGEKGRERWRDGERERERRTNSLQQSDTTRKTAPIPLPFKQVHKRLEQ
jgi:hypothetical protein